MKPRILVVEHEDDCTLDRFDGWLRKAGVELVISRPYTGEVVGDVGDATGLIVLGGSMGANDDDLIPWLPAVRRLIADAVRSGMPTLGICLGAQLLAVACGGRVERGVAGPEAGVVSVAWSAAAADDPLVGGLPDPSLLPSLHDDAIVELPPGSVLLGGTSTYAHQAFRLGPRAWGVQFHPELSPDAYERWAGSHPGADAEATATTMRTADARLVECGARLAQAFAASVLARAAAPAR